MSANLKLFPIGLDHEAVYQDLVALMDKYTAADVGKLEILAVAANIVGKLVALQDLAAVSPEEAMQVVIKNLQQGNEQAIQKQLSLLTSPETRQ